MNCLQKSALLFSELASSEKGYLKKFFKTRISVLSPKNADQLQTLFYFIETNSKDTNTDFTPETVRAVFNLLIAGLEEYHKTETTLARSYISQVEILLEKNLNMQAEKLLAKAKKLARKLANLEMLYEIIEWQVAIHSLKAPTDKNMKIFEDYFSELESVVQKQAKNFGVIL